MLLVTSVLTGRMSGYRSSALLTVPLAFEYGKQIEKIGHLHKIVCLYL